MKGGCCWFALREDSEARLLVLWKTEDVVEEEEDDDDDDEESVGYCGRCVLARRCERVSIWQRVLRSRSCSERLFLKSSSVIVMWLKDRRASGCDFWKNELPSKSAVAAENFKSGRAFLVCCGREEGRIGQVEQRGGGRSNGAAGVIVEESCLMIGKEAT